MENDFVTWLNKELKKRDWLQSDLARKTGMSTASVSLVLSQQRGPGKEFCESLARAFGYSPEFVFRVAGLLPPKNDTPPDIEKAAYMLESLPEPVRRVLMDSIETQYQRWENETKTGPEPAPNPSSP